MKKRKRKNIDIGSFCGDGVQLNGTLHVDGTIHFDGNIDGELEVGETLIVGKKGQIKAKVKTYNLINQGEILGDIVASNEIDLQEHSRTTGNVETVHFIVDDGAPFEGIFKMMPDLEKKE